MQAWTHRNQKAVNGHRRSGYYPSTHTSKRGITYHRPLLQRRTRWVQPNRERSLGKEKNRTKLPCLNVIDTVTKYSPTQNIFWLLVTTGIPACLNCSGFVSSLFQTIADSEDTRFCVWILSCCSIVWEGIGRNFFSLNYEFSVIVVAVHSDRVFDSFRI